MDKLGKHTKVKSKKSSILVMIMLFLAISIVFFLIRQSKGSNQLLTNKVSKENFKASPNVEVTQSEEIQSPDYNSKTKGSWQINKTAEWVGEGKAKVTVDLDSVMRESSEKKKDVVFVMDITVSGSSDSGIPVQIKAAEKMITEVLKDSENRVALCTFRGNTSVVCGFTNSEETLIRAMEPIGIGTTTDYCDLFTKLDKLLTDSDYTSEREVNIVIVGNGHYWFKHKEQIPEYEKFKAKYPLVNVNAIQYNAYNAKGEALKGVSDKQWGSNMYQMMDSVMEASTLPVYYNSFIVEDLINSEYFTLESIDDVEATRGEVSLVEENGIQEVVWNLDGLYTGSKPKMYMTLKLKDEFKNVENSYPINNGTNVYYQMLDENDKLINATKTPSLNSHYKVIFDTNLPNGQSTSKEEKHLVFSRVNKNVESPTCEGYMFKGWKVVDNVDSVNSDTFIMPSKDVHVKAIWSKVEISKSMDGTIKEEKLSTMFKTGTEVNIFMKTLAGNDLSMFDDTSKYSTPNTYKRTAFDTKGVSKFLFTESVPDEYKNENYVVSTPESSTPIYMWYNDEEKTIYWSTLAKQAQFNPDTSFFFAAMKSLDFTTVDWDKIDSSTATSYQCMFYDCYNLTEFDPIVLDFSNVTTVWSMFCINDYSTSPGLKKFNFANLKMPKVEVAQYMFSKCAFEEIDLTGAEMPLLNDARNMFYSCNALKKVNMGGIDTASLEYTWRMFSYCYNLEEVDMTNWNLSNLSDAEQMFGGCGKLKSLDFSTTGLSKLNSGMTMFKDCSKLESINFANCDFKELTNAQSMFSNCNALSNLDLSNINFSKLSNAYSMFLNCKGLKSINFGNSTLENLTNASSMFNGCSYLITINMGKANLINITNTVEMFCNCNRLETIYMNSFNKSKLTNSSNMFMYCSSSLVGAKGTSYEKVFDSKVTDKTFAVICAEGTPGYFTKGE